MCFCCSGSMTSRAIGTTILSNLACMEFFSCSFRLPLAACTRGSLGRFMADILGLFCITKLAEWGVIQNKDLMDNYVTFIAGIFRSCRFGAASAHGKANMMQFAHFIESGAITRDADKGYYTIDFEKMKKDIEIIAGEYITLEGDGDYDKASQLIATKGIVSPILQKDLDRIAQAGIPKDIYFQQGLQTLGL